MQRREFIKNLAALGIFLPWAGKSWSAGQPFDLVTLRQGWLTRLKAVAASGKIPLIDIESSYNPGKLDDVKPFHRNFSALQKKKS